VDILPYGEDAVVLGLEIRQKRDAGKKVTNTHRIIRMIDHMKYERLRQFTLEDIQRAQEHPEKE